MGSGVSLFLIAAGAILAYAVDYQTTGVDLDVIGVILIVVGAIGLLFSLLFWSSFAPWNLGGRGDRTSHGTTHHDTGHGHV